MKVIILGYGIQGKSSAAYWHTKGHSITVADSDTDTDIPDEYERKLGDDYLTDLHIYDLIVRSPSIHPSQIVSANPDYPDILSKVTTNTNEFFAVCPSKNLIGVTGTKGKGTTSTLISHMLEAAGFTVHLIGNIGTPPLEALTNISADDYVVLELANFQLIDLKYSPHTAVCVMVEPEHMDWHEDFEEYIAAKQQLFIHQSEKDIAIYFAQNENSEEVASASVGQLIPYFEAPGAYISSKSEIIIDDTLIAHTDDIALLGKHNWQNICAAITAIWPITQNITAIKKVITSFSGMEYRIQLIASKNNVDFYNDSFGTTPETAIVAIEAMSKPTVLIAGGSDKKSNYSELAKVIATKNVRHVLLIGEMSTRIAKELDNINFKDYSIEKDSFIDTVKKAHKLAKPEGAVLLSPACASFDMFKNYKDRGNHFNEAVKLIDVHD